jgi:hypothetical protein
MQAKWFYLLLLVVALGLALGAAPAQADDVGKFTRVVNEVEQSKPGKGPPQLAKVPGGIANQDLVETKLQAMAVVQFVDDSTITISPKSKVTIEDYMYDASKGHSKGAIKIAEGVVETIIPNKGNLEKKDIRIFTTTAIAGIRGTKLITVVKPGGESSIFYVIPEGKAKPKKSTITIRMFAPNIMPPAASVQFVTERLKRKLPLTQVISEALKAGLSPCDVVKAAILQGVKPEQLVEAFQKVCNEAPQDKASCNPATILKCTVEAMRALKEVNLAEMQYSLIMKDLAPITGDIKPQDLAAITALPTTGIQGTIPYSIPTQAQLNEAKLTQAAQAVAIAMINAGADPAAVNSGLQSVGVTQTPAATYTAATTPAPAPPPPGVGAGGQPPTIASPAQ